MTLNKVYLGLGGGSLLQVANRTHTQMMSYLIKTPDGKTVETRGRMSELNAQASFPIAFGDYLFT